jgi:hypothetical protein
VDPPYSQRRHAPRSHQVNHIDEVKTPSRPLLLVLDGQTSVCSAISRASSTSMPKYLTVL